MIKTNVFEADGSKWVDVSTQSGLDVRLSSVGAGVYSIVYKGKRLNLVLSDPKAYLSSPQCFGKTLGRVAGRIPCHVEVDGKPLDLIEEMQGFCLHGGTKQSLTYVPFETEVENDGKKATVRFHTLSKDGAARFPGNLDVTVSYVFDDEEATFEIVFDAVSDKDTPVSFSNHIYWDLDDDNDVSNQVLYIGADRYGTDDGKSQLVTGIDKVIPCLDFEKPTRLGDKLDVVEKTLPTKTIDHTFVFRKVETNLPQVTLENSRTKLSLYTDFEALNVYVDASLTPVKFQNGSDMIHTRRGIALEPQQFTFNHDHLILKKGERLHHWIRYVIESK